MNPSDRFALAPRGDADALAARFQAEERVQIRNFLQEADATALAATFEQHTDWRTVLNVGDRHVDLHAMQVAAADPRGPALLAASIAKGAADGFQYNFDNFPIFDAAANGEQMPSALARALALVRDAEFLNFLRAVTKDDRIAFADIQATRYRPGHFLTEHDDAAAGKNRLYAYVLNLTRAWRPDWGGVLVFYDQDANIEAGFTPSFNTLNLFRVPRRHAVTMVAPFAPRARFALTGWLRAA